VSAHYLVGEPKILFYFTAEARVDFRELVKDLVGIFKMRIELRQIGVRDEARVVGGVGVCGRTYCCHGVTDKLKAVSIKMAKEQNLTLNSMKISGPCGRLLCCLAYEYDTYKECRRGLPAEGARLRAAGQTLKVLDVNIFTRTLKLAGEDGKTLTMGFEAVGYDAQAGQWQVREPGA
jgi:cell fate regulator YaaT (PSP1 superfamily)